MNRKQESWVREAAKYAALQLQWKDFKNEERSSVSSVFFYLIVNHNIYNFLFAFLL